MFQRHRHTFGQCAPVQPFELGIRARINFGVSAPADRLQRTPVDLQRGGVLRQDPQVPVHEAEALVHAVEHVPQPLLARAQRLLRAVALDDPKPGIALESCDEEDTGFTEVSEPRVVVVASVKDHD